MPVCRYFYPSAGKLIGREYFMLDNTEGERITKCYRSS